MTEGPSDAGAERQPTDHELISLAQSLPLHNPQQAAACEELIARHEPIIRSCVRRYRDGREPAEDLMHVGYVALLQAILNFDPRLGKSLAAYAQPRVCGEIRQYSREAFQPSRRDAPLPGQVGDSLGDLRGMADQALQQAMNMQSV
jgi:RNA polymerase sigma factor (sigma-70 family)